MAFNKKYISLIYLACAGLAWLLFREILTVVAGLMPLKLPVDWILSPIDILAIILGGAVLVVMFWSDKVGTFTGEVVLELSRVTWPQRKETVLSTGVISVLVAVCAVVLFGFDMLWGMIVKVVYR